MAVATESTRTVTTSIHLGYQLGNGDPVAIPVKHMAITGQTQESGKTTTLEALVTRGNLRAVAFVTKRAEGAFRTGRRIPPYFRERADWQFVAAVLEATLRERLKFERSWIMRACKGATTLAQVHANVRTLAATAKGLSADVYLTLDEYLQIVVPQIERLPFADHLDIGPGLNIIDVSGYSMELQALVIRSVLEWIYEREQDTVTIIPEAWEFIPQNRASPVLLAAEQLIRKGAAARNFMWLDSQDIAGVHKNVLRSVIVWILGVQRETNEVRRMLEHVPSMPKPTVAQVMQLGRGQFYACWAHHVIPVYVQPAGVSDQAARDAAAGGVAATIPQTKEEDTMSVAERTQYEQRIAQLEHELESARADRGEIQHLNARASELEATNRLLVKAQSDGKEAVATLAKVRAAFAVLGAPVTGGAGRVDVDTIVARVLERLPASGGAIVVQAPEALRKEFQQREVERVLTELRALPARPRDAVRLLEASGQWIGTKALAARLGVPTAGDSYVKFSRAINEVAEAGYIERQERQGLHGALRQKLAADLSVYQPAEADVEQVYATCLMALTDGQDGSPA